MLAALALALLATAGPQQDPGTGSVSGRVRSERTGEPLAHAVVEVRGLAQPRVAVADSAGAYRLTGIPAGLRQLRVRHFDHAPLELEVMVASGRELTLDLALAFQPVVLAPVTAEARPLPPLSDTLAAPAPELGRAALRALEATPGVAELGMGDALGRGNPGQEPADPSDVLYVRGAPADLKLVLLDGAPVYAPFHVAGLVYAFAPGVLRSADLHLGGAPARYDGGLSYVMNLQTRAALPAASHASLAVDLLSAQAMAETPLTRRAGLLVSGRSVHGIGTGWLWNDDFPYGYADLLGRVHADLGERDGVAATGFWNRETVRIDGEAIGDEANASWGNGAGSLRYHGVLGGSELEVTAALGTFQATLPLGGQRRMAVDGMARRARLAADLTRRFETTRLHYGLSLETMTLGYEARSRADAGAEVFESISEGRTGGAYVDVAWNPAASLRLRSGLRADVFSTDAALRFAPRLSATWLLSERAALTLAAGRYRQFTRSMDPAVVAEPRMGEELLATPPMLALARATHVVVALDQDLGEGIRLGVEGFYKTFEGLPAATAPAAGAPASGNPASGDPGSGMNGAVEVRSASGGARASGVDLWLRRSEGRTTGWLGYSLNWVWSRHAGASQVTESFAGRQIISAGLAGHFGASGRFDLRFGYGAGLPYAAISHGATPDVAYDASERAAVPALQNTAAEAPPLATPPDEQYIRIDAEFSHPWTGEWRGRRITFTPYLKVFNALDRRDALFYRYDRLRDPQPQPVASLPFLPVFGFRWAF